MAAVLTIERLSKSFLGQLALDDVDLVVNAGRTHALVGQNGSGKSTLIKVLCGYHEPTGPSRAATFTADGTERELALGDARSAADAGIRFVHQDLGLVDALSAVENISMGVGYTTRTRGFGALARIDWKADTERARRALADLGFTDFDVRMPVGRLAPSQKTAVAIARALEGWEHGASLLVLDEPTASLPGADVQRLFAAIRRLKERGVAILYVSHHLDEVFEIADEVTVLRDGRRITTVPAQDLDHQRLIELMVGHRVERGRQLPRDRTNDAPTLRVHGLHGATIAGLDLDIEPGEIVGVAGITGSGREALVPLITGQVPSLDGAVHVSGTPVANYAPGSALAAGMAFLAADRGTQGIVRGQSVRTNLTLADVAKHRRGGRIRHDDERSEVQRWITQLRIKTAGTEVPIDTLSGGNQQKVLFGRSLRLLPSVLVLDEPTRGIDVGAKEEIHALINGAAADGCAVLVASTDTDELVRLAHRVLVMRNGRIAAELSGGEMTVERIEHAQLQAQQEVGSR
jgi:ribose transport system ATP-binding protein